MEHHDCKPPGGRQPIDLDRSTCPECGDLWEARLLGVEGYDFANEEAFTKKEWTRVRSGEASPRVLVGAFREPEGTELRCSFCGKPRSSVRQLISGPGQGPRRVLICNECIDLCAEIIAEEEAEIEAEQEQALKDKPASGPATETE
jgi:hypothetical protein